jgi:hypothetical protein
MKLPIQDRKKDVINLHIRGYTIRQIAEKLHMSSRDVTEIIKEYEREQNDARNKEVIEKEENESKRIFSSKRSEALQLYKKGMNPLDVAIQLKIDPEEAKAIFLQYLSLQDLENVVTIYKKLNNKQAFESLLGLYYYLEENNISKEEIVKLNKMINTLTRIREEYNRISNQLTDLKSQRDEIISNIKFFQNKLYETSIKVKSLLDTIDSLKQELQSINNEILYKKQLLEDIKNSKEYKNLEMKIEKEIEKCLNQKKDFIISAFETILKFMKNDKNTKFFIKNLYSSPQIFVDHYISNYENQIIDMADILYADIVKSITNKIVNP